MNSLSASFRALYQNTNTQFSSTCNWTNDGRPTDKRNGTLLYNPDIFNVNKWDINNSSHKNSIRWSNEFFQKLPNNWAISASFELAYDHINQTQVRSESDINIRDFTAKENIWGTATGFDISKPFNEKHNLAIELTGITYSSKINYTGSTVNHNDNFHLLIFPGAKYTFTPNDKFYSNIGIYATYYRSKTGDEKESKVYPTVNFDLSWMPLRRHRFGLWLNYTINTPNGSQTNGVLLQTDLLKWSQGNPQLHSYHTLSTQLSYTWNPTQFINISPVATWVYKHDYYAETYSLTEDGKGILVKPMNCGNYHNFWASINFSAYAFNRKLVVQARPTVSFHKFMGEFDKSLTCFLATLSATYYCGNFYVGASYSTPETSYNHADPIRRKILSEYWLMAGWGNASWTVSAFLINPFRSHWRGEEMKIDTPVYSMSSTTIGVNDHRRINLTLAYTFGYGKKVQRGNDLKATSGSASSIR